MESSERRRKVWGVVFIGLWGLLIALGILAKRQYGHPEWMMMFHVPAAVFLVLGMRQFSADFRKAYEREIRDYGQKPDLRQGIPPGQSLK